MSDYNKRVDGVELFVVLMQTFDNLKEPHEALASMITHNRNIEEVRKYLLAMVNEIEEVQNAN